MNEEVRFNARVTSGILCASNRAPSVTLEGDSRGVGGGGHSGFSDGLAAALPYWGAAIGWLAGGLLVRWLTP